MSQPLSTLLARFIGTAFPRPCAGCGGWPLDPTLPQTTIFCPTCADSIEPIKDPVCLRCGLPMPTALASSGRRTCRDCTTTPPPFNRARAALLYEPPATDAIAALKYKRQIALANGLALLAATAAESAGLRIETYDAIIPLPTPRRRLLARGFNHAALIAHPIATWYRTPLWLTALDRAGDPRRQAERTREERLTLPTTAFRVTNPDAVAQKRLLLVDDVLTTGATARAAAGALRAANAREVDVLVVARTPRDHVDAAW